MNENDLPAIDEDLRAAASVPTFRKFRRSRPFRQHLATFEAARQPIGSRCRRLDVPFFEYKSPALTRATRMVNADPSIVPTFRLATGSTFGQAVCTESPSFMTQPPSSDLLRKGMSKLIRSHAARLRRPTRRLDSTRTTFRKTRSSTTPSKQNRRKTRDARGLSFMGGFWWASFAILELAQLGSCPRWRVLLAACPP